MAWGRGLDLICGIAKATTWGTAVNVNTTGTVFRPTAWSVQETIEPGPDKSFNADAFDRVSTITMRSRISGTFTVDLKYEGLNVLQALFFGTAGVPSGGGPYVHTWYRKNNTDGIFGTLCWYDGIKTHEVDAVKITGLKYSAKLGQTLQLTVTWTGRRRQENTGTNANMSSATEVTTINRVKSIASTNTYHFAAVGSSLAAVEMNEWEVDLKREYDDDDRAFSTTDAPWRREMVGGAATGTWKIVRPHDATTYIALAESGAAYKAMFLHTLSSTQIFELGLPCMTVENWTANPSGKGGIPQEISGRLDVFTSTPSGLDAAVPYVTATNNTSTDPLA